VRRAALKREGYDVSGLPNIDFVDAALCAAAADAFRINRYQLFGDREEGFIVVPTSSVA
jgi:predicted RNase H-like nuclease